MDREWRHHRPVRRRRHVRRPTLAPTVARRRPVSGARAAPPCRPMPPPHAALRSKRTPHLPMPPPMPPGRDAPAGRRQRRWHSAAAFAAAPKACSAVGGRQGAAASAAAQRQRHRTAADQPTAPAHGSRDRACRRRCARASTGLPDVSPQPIRLPRRLLRIASTPTRNASIDGVRQQHEPPALTRVRLR